MKPGEFISSDERFTIVCADNREILQNLAAGSVDRLSLRDARAGQTSIFDAIGEAK